MLQIEVFQNVFVVTCYKAENQPRVKGTDRWAVFNRHI
jgi:hypothetical protein